MYNIKYFKAKEQLLIFFANFKPTDNNKQTYDIQYMYKAIFETKLFKKETYSSTSYFNTIDTQKGIVN